MKNNILRELLVVSAKQKTIGYSTANDISCVLNHCGYSFVIMDFCFYNCQKWSIYGFDNLLIICQDRNIDIKHAIYSLKEKFKINRRLLELDIDESIFDRIKRKLKLYGRSTRYINLTGSSMVRCTFDTGWSIENEPIENN